MAISPCVIEHLMSGNSVGNRWRVKQRCSPRSGKQRMDTPPSALRHPSGRPDLAKSSCSQIAFERLNPCRAVPGRILPALRSRIATDVDITLDRVQLVTTRIGDIHFMQFKTCRVARPCSQNLPISHHLVRLDQFHGRSPIVVTMNPMLARCRNRRLRLRGMRPQPPWSRA